MCRTQQAQLCAQSLGVSAFPSFGVSEFRLFRVLAFSSFGFSEFWRFRVLAFPKFWRFRILAFSIFGFSEFRLFRSFGVFEFWRFLFSANFDKCNGVSNTTALHVINMPYFLDETTFHELSIGLNCQRSPHARISTPPKSRVKVSAIVHMLSEWSTSIQIKPNWSSPWNYMLFHEIIWISNVKYHEYSYMKLVWFRSFVETIMVSTRVRNSTNFKTNFKFP